MIVARHTGAANVPLPVLRQNIPDELTSCPHWVAWVYDTSNPRRKKPEKVPLNPRTGRRADPTNPRTWAAFDDAHGFYLDRKLSGVGFVFHQSDPFAGLDRDGIRDPQSGVIDPLAVAMLKEVRTYSELSPSGTGAKAYGRARIDPHGPKSDRHSGIEVYDRGRFFAVTGHKLPFAPAGVRPCEAELRRIQDLLRKTPPAPRECRAGGFPGDDAALLAVAFGAKNGVKVRQLWDGRHSHPSASEALLALANCLAFYTGDDPDRLDRLMVRSRLYATTEAERAKWDSRRRGGSWGRRYVVDRAISDCRRFYGVGRTARGGVRVVSATDVPNKTEDEAPSRKTQPCGSHGVQFGGVRAAWNRATAGEVPSGLEMVTGRGDKTRHQRRRLAALCWNLSRQSRDRRFFLAEEDAARLIGVERTTINRWLKLLRSRPLCLIRRVSTGNSLSGMASVYQWTGSKRMPGACAEQRVSPPAGDI